MATKMFSLRLRSETLYSLEQRARERSESKSSLAQRLIEEGLRLEEHSGIEFRDGPTGRRAAVVEGPDVWELMSAIWAEGGGEQGLERVAASLRIPVHRLRDAVRYYAAYPAEIDERIRRNRELAERAEADWQHEQEALAG